MDEIDTRQEWKRKGIKKLISMLWDLTNYQIVLTYAPSCTNISEAYDNSVLNTRIRILIFLYSTSCILFMENKYHTIDMAG